LKGGEWVIDCEPHVAIRLKRVFGRAARAGGRVTLTDSVETARDLQWFCERFPLVVTPREHLDRRAEQHREREVILSAITSGDYQPRRFELAVPARGYQAMAAEMTLQMQSLLLADDVGIGKTASAIAMLIEPATRPALVVTLTHLPRQWQSELRKFAPSLRVHLIKKGTPYDLVGKQRGFFSEFPDVLVINYHKLAGWADALAPHIRAIIFDEVQELRHRKSGTGISQKYAAAKQLADAATYRLGLSATPIHNLGGEMWSVLDVLRPGALGSWPEFLREWCGDHADEKGRAKIGNAKAFGSYLREHGLMLRRTRKDVGRELPELTRIEHEVDADTRAIEAAESAAMELARIVLHQGAQARGEKWKAAKELNWRMRQATGLAKARYVADFVRLLVENGERVVLYGWHREVYGIWLERLQDLAPAMYTGSESPTQKEQAKQRFIAGETPVLIMSLRAGAGLDGLQGHCRTVVFGELDWSPAVHEQAIGRVHRDGQGDPVVAYFLTADSGSDPVIADTLQVKKGQIQGIRDPDAALVEQLQGGGDNVRRLAEALLKRRGVRASGETAPPADESSERRQVG